MFEKRFYLFGALVFLFSLFIFSGNSYASITYDTLKAGIDKVYNDNNLSQYGEKTYPNYEDIETYLNDYDTFIINVAERTDRFNIYFGFDLYRRRIGSSSFVASTFRQDFLVSSSGHMPRYDFYWLNNYPSNYGGTLYADGSLSVLDMSAVYGEIYDDSSLNTIYYNGTIVEVPTNSILLTALKSGAKFTFTDKTQLQVDLVGYTIDEFRFYVQRYIDGEWETFTDTNDYYRLNNYENPYYIFWANLNYFPVGTYRYMAVNSTSDVVAYSSEFQITQSVIDNPATGTIDDGNIDINIDTGKTVDDIKDYLGQDPTVTENQFEDSFPTVDVDDPTADFFTWFFEQIKNCFTVSTSQYLSFSLYGKTFTINSDDYIINILILRTVIGGGSAIFIFYAIFLDIRREIEKVKEGKFAEVGKDDITASML